MLGVLPSWFFPYTNTFSINTYGADSFLTPILQGGTPKGTERCRNLCRIQNQDSWNSEALFRILAETNAPKNHNIGEK